MTCVRGLLYYNDDDDDDDIVFCQRLTVAALCLTEYRQRTPSLNSD